MSESDSDCEAKVKAHKSKNVHFDTNFETTAWNYMRSESPLSINFLKVYKNFLNFILVNKEGNFVGFQRQPKMICKILMKDAERTLRLLQQEDLSDISFSSDENALTDGQCDQLYSKIME